MGEEYWARASLIVLPPITRELPKWYNHVHSFPGLGWCGVSTSICLPTSTIPTPSSPWIWEGIEELSGTGHVEAKGPLAHHSPLFHMLSSSPFPIFFEIQEAGRAAAGGKPPTSNPLLEVTVSICIINRRALKLLWEHPKELWQDATYPPQNAVFNHVLLGLVHRALSDVHPTIGACACLQGHTLVCATWCMICK